MVRDGGRCSWRGGGGVRVRTREQGDRGPRGQPGGPELWDRIRERAGLPTLSFVSLDTYPDEVTYRLVEAASEVLDMSPAAVLEAFGDYWVRYTAREGYGELMDAYGNDVQSFLRNLNAMHARVRMVMPGLKPPTFTIQEAGPGRFVLHYHSSRDGLAPMVVGLLRGLGAKFDQEISVEHTGRRGEGLGHDVFEVTVGQPIKSPTAALSESR